jgi:hypothetical protein
VAIHLARCPEATAIAAGCSLGIILAAAGAVYAYVPPKSEMEALRTERARLEASIEDLTERGGKLMLSSCGPTKRLCVFIDASAGKFGDAKLGENYWVAMGY